MSAPWILHDRYAVSTADRREGAMAEVFSASDLAQGHRKVAVKLFRNDAFDDEVLSEVFRRESEALRQLRHPNIVELLDFGHDKPSGRSFLILEWVENSLEQRARSIPSEGLGWDTFAESYGIQILRALDVAHSRNIIHRDLKPANVLLDDAETVKLADFGIAKLVRRLQAPLTLENFKTHPFAPPEPDSGEYSYTRDVYAFGILALRFVSGQPIAGPEDVQPAIEAVDAPDRIVELLSACTSLDPTKRPRTAGVLAADIQAIQDQRRQKWASRPKCFLQFSKNAQDRLRDEYPALSLEQRAATYLEQANAGSALQFGRKEGGKIDPDELHLVSSTLKSVLHRHKDHADRLVVSSIYVDSPSFLETLRDRSMPTNILFLAGPPPNAQEATASREAISALRDTLQDFESSLRTRQEMDAKERPFRVWGDLLRAMGDLQMARLQPITFRSSELKDSRVVLHLEPRLSPDALFDLPMSDFRWCIRTIDGQTISGIIVSIADHQIVFDPVFGDLAKLPKSGRLEVDVSRSQVAVERQRQALDAVRYNQAVRGDLGTLLLSPASSRAPQPLDHPPVAITDLDASKREAVLSALAAPDIYLVEGPPGTGKTSFIAELVLQSLRRIPTARILISSQTNVAVDNALQRIRDLQPSTRVIRLGREDDERVSHWARPLLPDRQVVVWARSARDSGDSFLTRCAKEAGLDPEHIRTGVLLQDLAARLRRLREVSSMLDDMAAASTPHEQVASPSSEISLPLTPEPEVTPTRLREDRMVLRKEIQDLRKRLSSISPDLAEISAEDDPDALDSWAVDYCGTTQEANSLGRLAQLHATWCQRLSRPDDFVASVALDAQVVGATCLGMLSSAVFRNLTFDLCILDEASKATPTELLVPMTRAQSWVLVGDRMQLPPYVDPALLDSQILERFSLERTDVEASLFSRLADSLPPACTHFLNVQHRMVPEIGRLISSCFYSDKLKSAEKDHPKALNAVFPRPVTWFSTCRISSRHETRAGSSYLNHVEVQEICKLLQRLHWALSNSKVSAGPMSVGILSGYAAQVRELQRSVDSVSRSLSPILRIEVNTIDAFQGRQVDVAILSLARSNPEGRIGFLKSRERLNVALSRGSLAIAIFGDHVALTRGEADNPIASVRTYIEKSPQDCIIQELAP